MSLNERLEMNDEEVFKLINEEFSLMEKQATLYNIINEMMDQIEKVQKHEEEMELKLERLQRENISLRQSIKDLSK